ncbi:ATP-binding cassette domain-containing protein [Anaerovibrio sp.]|uniref:ATP-binding cassette domain-containing protein n=1 Tax=Anaerovibrio sp. TaxID=1872532 RepID=UPI003F19051C
MAGNRLQGELLVSGRVLHNVELEAAAGEITAIVGPDGAGKTTLMRMVCGLLPLGRGSHLQVAGIDVAKEPQRVQALISYLPQKFGLYEDLTVQENIDLYADLHGVPGPVRQKRVDRLLHMTELYGFTDRLAGRLSGGMKQKLGLICTLVRSPILLLLDEPSVGVDPLSRRELWEILEQLVQEEGLTVLVNTAYAEEAERCQMIYMLDKGSLLAKGTVHELQEEWPRGLKGMNGTGAGRSGRHTAAVAEDRAGDRLEDRAEGMAGDVRQTAEADIVVHDLVKRFGDFTAVSHTSFNVYKGEVFGMLGPNGAGKTTTFRMLCGLLPATSGELSVGGVDVRRHRNRAREGIGYVAQKFSLYGNLTVYENLRFYGGIYGLYGKELARRIDELVAEFGLGEKLKQAADSLPLGYKQRLSMAAALLHRPKILFLDEPTSGIDPEARQNFWRQIDRLSAAGTTIIVTTHFMEEAEYCDRIMIQDHGEMLILGSPEEIRRRMGMPGAGMNEIFIAIVEKARRQEGGSSHG